jgi:choline transport protein
MYTANHTYEMGNAALVPSTEMKAFDDGFPPKESVPKTYQGTAADRHEMSVLGKKQVLRRQFKFTTMLGFASTVMVAWEFVLLVSPFGLVNGGTPAVFWGLILSPVVMLPVYASLAEVASMSPTAGGKFATPIQTTVPNI